MQLTARLQYYLVPENHVTKSLLSQLAPPPRSPNSLALYRVHLQDNVSFFEGQAAMLPKRGPLSKSRQAAKSVDEALDRFGYGPFHIRLLLLIGLVHIADINDAFLTPYLQRRVSCLWKLSILQRNILTLVSTLGICLGCPVAGYFADLFGRRNVLIVTCFAATLFGGITAAVFHYPWLLVLRFLTTFSVGGTKCVALAYLVEFLPKKNRGKVLVSFLFFWTLGCLFTLLLLYLVLPAGWRPVVVLSVVPNALATILANFLPQSPHFLHLKGRELETDDVLSIIGHTNQCDKTNFIVPLCPVEEEPLDKVNWRQILRPTNFAIFCRRFRSFFGLFLLWLLLSFSTSFSQDVNYSLPFTPRECMSKQGLNYLIRLQTFTVADFRFHKFTDDSCCEAVPLNFRRMTGNAVHYGLGCLLALLVIDQMGRRISMMFCSAFACLVFLPLNFCTPALVREVLLILTTSCSAAAQGSLAVYTAEFWPTSNRAFLVGICWSIGAVTITIESPLLKVLVSVFTDRPAYIFNTVMLLVCALLPLILPFETTDWSLSQTPLQMLERIDETPMNSLDGYAREEKRRKKKRILNETTPLR